MVTHCVCPLPRPAAVARRPLGKPSPQRDPRGGHMPGAGGAPGSDPSSEGSEQFGLTFWDPGSA